MTPPTIAVTGSSGHIGGMVAQRLSHAEFPLVLPLRNPAKAPELPHSEARVCSYADKTAAKAALNGISVLFMVSAGESLTRAAEHRTFVSAAAEAGVQHIVYLSFAGADAHSTFTLARTHADTEAAIQASGISHTFLRDNFYSEMMAELAGPDHIIRGPAGNGRVACVSQYDVAEAAANILQDIAAGGSRHRNQTYTLTGSESLSLTDIAAQLSTYRGTNYRFHNETTEEAYAARRAGYPDTPDWMLDAWVSTYTAIAADELARIYPDLADILDRTPRTFQQVLQEKAV
ncbi:NAD(P)H-binding protein [Uruburuella testudinis]|uniref:NAD(P)H-binding protein n=1 Tax=Uruburuella testudinis TaxID=1282863 RepID=A0ABY4DQX6_9NEIS|nr:NAD(P)H-binding protein [Uruburuella testudinis]UOO81120.1 NAD(P)H-binding protein [Uruburuella testudinis]